MKKNSFLISGSNGFIGKNLINFIKNKNYYVKTIGNKKNCDIQYNFSSQKFHDINIKKNYYEYFIHLEMRNETYFKKNYFKTLKNNTNSIFNSIKVAKEKNIKKFIYFSTYHVFSNISGIVNENTIPNPSDYYSISHYINEKIIQTMLEKSNIDFLILRPSNIYGIPIGNEFKRSTLLPFEICNQAIKNNKIKLKTNGKQIKNFVSIDSIFEFLIYFKKNKKIVHMSGNHNISLLDFAKRIQFVFKTKFNKEIEIITNPKDKNIYNKFKFKSKYFKPIYDDLEDFIFKYVQWKSK